MKKNDENNNILDYHQVDNHQGDFFTRAIDDNSPSLTPYSDQANKYRGAAKQVSQQTASERASKI
jgi:hypothetical protein